MATTIKCTNCNQEIEVTQAIRQELQVQVLKEVESKHEQELVTLKLEQKKLIELKTQEFEEARKNISQQARVEAINKIRIEYDQKIQATKEEAESNSKQNKLLQQQLSDLIKQTRELKNAKDSLSLEYEKKLLEEQDKIKQIAKTEALDELSLRIAEKDKKLSDALKANEDLKRKLEQGSQQLQGEVFELAVEAQLKQSFPQDIIKEVKKGQHGADIIQTVRDMQGQKVGEILWEVKNAYWQKNWLTKLREDQRHHGAALAVLISIHRPAEYGELYYHEGVWLTSRATAVGLAMALRTQLLKINQERLNQEGKAEKMEELYRYLTSVEFKHRIEAIVEAFNHLKEDLDKEKRWFNAKWTRQEKELTKIIEHTGGIHAQLQGVTARQLQPISAFELD